MPAMPTPSAPAPLCTGHAPWLTMSRRECLNRLALGVGILRAPLGLLLHAAPHEHEPALAFAALRLGATLPALPRRQLSGRAAG